VQFMAEVNVQSYNEKKGFRLGIKTDVVSLMLLPGRHGGSFRFYSKANLNNINRGMNTGFDLKDFGVIFNYNWKINETYKLLISQATDSAGNFSMYSGYVFLPGENKWKFIGSCKIEGNWNTIQQPAFACYSRKKQNIFFSTGEVWIQRQNGSWKNMKNDPLPNPTINLYGHIDSAEQRKTDIKIIEDAIVSGKTDVKENIESVYYKMMKEGTGKQVSVNDTVTVNYRLSLFNDTAVIQETKDKPATFPLKRLIRGWQIGVPLCKAGGKIKLVIPSDLGYSIRTRAADIPPNSILVFEIEVLDAKSPL
ncbi:MAG TPA: FKBP-type peptidyl-prolyl cis-trans isomerase, partial [Chitinophagaceae bacterium]